MSNRVMAARGDSIKRHLKRLAKNRNKMPFSKMPWVDRVRFAEAHCEICGCHHIKVLARCRYSGKPRFRCEGCEDEWSASMDGNSWGAFWGIPPLYTHRCEECGALRYADREKCTECGAAAASVKLEPGFM